MSFVNAGKLMLLTEWHRFIVWRIERNQKALERWEAQEAKSDQRAKAWGVDVGDVLRPLGLPY